MTTNGIVSRKEWFAAHKAHLAREKEFTRLRDELSAERLRLPWLRVDKDYVFDTTEGEKSLADLFAGRSQLIVYHFMFGPGADYRCEGCSLLCDHIDAANLHLPHHDVTLLVASRAPLEELLPYRKRMGWRFDWVSSGRSDFNYDMQVSFTDRQIAEGDTVYNFEAVPLTSKDLPGVSVFCKDENGDIFLTFTTRARGGDILIGAYNYLDMAPKGRNETPFVHHPMEWVRLHDEYGDAPEEQKAHCCA